MWQGRSALDAVELMDIGWNFRREHLAQGAALMTNTTVTSRVLGSAWPQHFNRPVAEAMYENIKQVDCRNGVMRIKRSRRRCKKS